MDPGVKLLVTGGAGFIGSNFVRDVLDRTDDSVITLDALTYAGSTSNLGDALDHPRHEFVEGDVRDSELVEELLERVDAVVNFAAESHVDRAIEGAASFVRTNVEGTQTLLEAARSADLDRFIQVSTDEVYGQCSDGAFAETDRLDPRNPYAASKAGADHLALSYYETHGLPVVITRSSNNYGPRQHREKLIPKFVVRAAAGDSLPVYGDGSNVREWTYVTDNCRAIDRVLRAGADGEIYNVGSGVERTNLEVTRAILELVDAPASLVEFVEDRPGHDQRYALETAKIRDLGWEPRVDFEAGLERTAEYYLDTVSRPTP